MTKAQAQVIVTEAIACLCKKHGVTAAQIEQAVRAGNQKVISQLATLMTAGIGAANV